MLIDQHCCRPFTRPHLDRLNPARPEGEASSISGGMIFSIMSVSTVKVGSTMKSMKPVREVK